MSKFIVVFRTDHMEESYWFLSVDDNPEEVKVFSSEQEAWDGAAWSNREGFHLTYQVVELMI